MPPSAPLAGWEIHERHKIGIFSRRFFEVMRVNCSNLRDVSIDNIMEISRRFFLSLLWEKSIQLPEASIQDAFSIDLTEVGFIDAALRSMGWLGNL
jgi:hypothetical protein